MKYKVVYSTKFRKDKKRYQHDIAKMKALLTVTKHLERMGSVPAEYRPHKLHGIYEGCMECHIESNFLLIWVIGQTLYGLKGLEHTMSFSGSKIVGYPENARHISR